MPAQSIPNWEDFLFFRSFSYGKNKGGGGNEGAQIERGAKENRDENIPDLPNLTAYEDYKLLFRVFY